MIIVETYDGLVLYLDEGQTYFADDGRDITYEQMLGWMLDGSLRQHGFYPYKCSRLKSNCNNNNYAARHARQTLLLAATI